MQTHKCTFSWIPDRLIQDAQRPYLPNTVAGILLNWRIAHPLRAEQQVPDHEVPTAATIAFNEASDPGALEELKVRAATLNVAVHATLQSPAPPAPAT